MPKRILVVDDDPDALELLTFNLKKAGFVIGTARNGLDALKKACSVAPDLILLDLMMPELDGFAVCEILRRDPVTASIPIIFVTALSSELGRLNGLDAGASAYVTKPYSPRELVSQVRSLLARSGTQVARPAALGKRLLGPSADLLGSPKEQGPNH